MWGPSGGRTGRSVRGPGHANQAEGGGRRRRRRRGGRGQSGTGNRQRHRPRNGERCPRLAGGPGVRTGTGGRGGGQAGRRLASPLPEASARLGRAGPQVGDTGRLPPMAAWTPANIPQSPPQGLGAHLTAGPGWLCLRGVGHQQALRLLGHPPPRADPAGFIDNQPLRKAGEFYFTLLFLPNCVWLIVRPH